MLSRLFILALIGFTACTTSFMSFAQPVDANRDKIALVMKALSNPFFSKMEAGAKEYASEHGIALEVFGTELETDVEYQISIINNLITRNYGAIVIAPVDSHKLIPSFKKAIDQGITVINIDNPLDQKTLADQGLNIPFVGSDNAKGAALVGHYLRRQMQGKGRVIIIEGIRGVENADQRKAGFTKAITTGGGIEIVDSVSANWHTEDAFTHMTELLKKHGAVDAIFCANDQMALGVLQALDSQTQTALVLVTGYDNIEAARNELRNGRMHATVEQHPELMGRYGIALAHEAMQGRPIPTYQETPLDLITHDSFGKRIALAMSEMANPFFTALFKGAQTHAELHGMELLHSDAKNDDTQQLVAIQNFVGQKVDFLIVNPTNSQAVQPGIEMAHSARIPVITVDRKEDGGQVLSHIASDNITGGQLAAEYLIRQLPGGGAIVEFEGIPGTSASYERGKGFNDRIAQHNDLKIVKREVAYFSRDEARIIMQRLLAANQTTFDAIFAHNDNMILGVLDALQAAHVVQRPLLIGFDAIPEARQAITENKLSATIAQKPQLMGILAIDTAVKALRGEKVATFIPVELELIKSSQ
ncbi:MAG: substrate-binding domain-containing protein [Candidatus Competibacteraceae bacterium]|nr:substrate-binding domain-containing protein [Candidatus Competibacteraceae bacterium]